METLGGDAKSRRTRGSGVDRRRVVVDDEAAATIDPDAAIKVKLKSELAAAQMEAMRLENELLRQKMEALRSQELRGQDSAPDPDAAAGADRVCNISTGVGAVLVGSDGTILSARRTGSSHSLGEGATGTTRRNSKLDNTRQSMRGWLTKTAKGAVAHPIV